MVIYHEIENKRTSVRNIFQKKQIINRLKKKHIIIGRNVKFTNTTFGGNNAVGSETNINHSIIGFGTYMNSRCNLSESRIGKFSSIASDVTIIRGQHPVSEYITTCPAFYSRDFGGGFSYVRRNYFMPFKYANKKRKFVVDIGNDVWIGQNVMIMEGITIGDGSIVGAGALVTRDVAPYSVVVGIPARVIKKRFSQNDIDCLLQFKWWNKDKQWIEKYADNFRNPKNFIKMLKNEGME